MSGAIIVPLTVDDCLHRGRAWEWVRARYVERFPDWPIFTGSVSGAWSKGAAIADALTRTDAELLIVADADVWPSEDMQPSIDAVRLGRRRWATPHHHVFRFTETATTEVLAGADPANVAQARRACSQSHVAMPGGGIVVVDRALYDECPIDARFEGWGGEDQAWAFALVTIGGRRHRGGGILWHLWHPPAERLNRKIGSDRNEALRARYQAAGGNVDAMRALIAEGQQWASRTSSSRPQRSSTRA